MGKLPLITLKVKVCRLLTTRTTAVSAWEHKGRSLYACTFNACETVALSAAPTSRAVSN